MPNPSFGQIIIVAKNVEARDRLRAQLKEIAHRDFVGIDIQVELLPMDTAKDLGGLFELTTAR